MIDSSHPEMGTALVLQSILREQEQLFLRGGRPVGEGVTSWAEETALARTARGGMLASHRFVCTGHQQVYLSSGVSGKEGKLTMADLPEKAAEPIIFSSDSILK